MQKLLLLAIMISSSVGLIANEEEQSFFTFDQVSPSDKELSYQCSRLYQQGLLDMCDHEVFCLIKDSRCLGSVSLQVKSYMEGFFWNIPAKEYREGKNKIISKIVNSSHKRDFIKFTLKGVYNQEVIVKFKPY